MTNQNLVIGNIYHIAVITVTTTPTPIETLLSTALSAVTKTFDRTVRGRDVLQVTLSPAAAILMQDRDNGASHQLSINASKTIPVLNPLGQILLSCASATVSCIVEYITQDPTRS